MAVTAKALTRKYNTSRGNDSSGAMMALQNVGDLLNNTLTHKEFDGVTNHIVSTVADASIQPARKAFNEGYLEMLETLLDL